MESVLRVTAALLLFAGTHLGLAAPPIRARLVHRFGEIGFRLAFSLVAAVTFGLLTHTYAVYRHDGPTAFGATIGTPLHTLAWFVAAAGTTLAVAGLLAYPESPMDPSAPRHAAPTPLARITRHPFFAGVLLLGVAHMVLVSHVTGVVFFGGLTLYTAIGMREQDRKLLALRGATYAAYCRETSAIPFAAVVAGRTRLGVGDFPVVPLLFGAAATAVLRWAHPYLLGWDGWGLAIAITGGAGLFGLVAFVRLALRRGHARELAMAGAVLVLHVGLAHEVIGARLYPDGPALLGGPLVWHAVGAAGIACGVLLIAAALDALTLPTRALATTMIAIGAIFLAVDAVAHGGFHFFAATLVAGAWLVRVAADDATTGPAATRNA